MSFDAGGSVLTITNSEIKMQGFQIKINPGNDKLEPQNYLSLFKLIEEIALGSVRDSFHKKILSPKNLEFNEHFILINEKNEPLTEFFYGLETPFGYEEGMFDENGRTHLISTNTPQNIKLDYVFQLTPRTKK
jgi:hypothetical protein